MRTSFLFSLILFLRISSFGQDINGMVIDSETKLPLEYASIGIINTHAGTITDKNGDFSFKAKIDSTSIIRISMIGYES